MAFLDSFVDPFFKKDGEGRTLYFPWGNIGSAIVIDTDETERKIRKFLKLTYLAVFVAFIVCINLFGSLWTLAIIPVYLVWFVLGIRLLTKGLPRSTEKLKTSEVRIKQAQSIGWFWTVFMILGNILILWSMIWYFEASTQPYMGIFLIVVSVFLLVFLFTLALIKIRISRNTKS